MTKNKSKKIIAGIILAAAALVFIAAAVWSANSQNGAVRNAVSVQWSHPERQTIVNSVNARGTVELVERTTVFAQTQAQVVRVYAEPGDFVEEGALLLRYDEDALDSLHDTLAEARLALRAAQLGLAATQIEPADAEVFAAENRIDQARGNIAAIHAQLEQSDLSIGQIELSIALARSQAADLAELFESGVISRSELAAAADSVRRLEDQLAIARSQRDATALNIGMAVESERLAIAQFEALTNRAAQPAARNQAEIQQVNISQAQLRIEQIERQISDFVPYETAPVSGTVLSVNIREGENTASGRVIAEIADTSNLVVTVFVPETQAASIVLGQQAEISGGALGTETIMGTLTRIHPVAAPRQIGNITETVLTVEITPSEIGQLRPGLTVDADIVLDISEDAMVVPLMATVSEGGGQNYVYLIDDEHFARRTAVELGAHSGIYIEVTGLADEDMVISNVGPQISDGAAVRPVAQ